MTFRLGILLTGFVPEQLEDIYVPYQDMFRKYLGQDDFTYRIYTIFENEFPDDIQACDGWLITGSQYGAYEDHDWITPLEAIIQAIQAARLPCIGICFGHQIMAQAMGGKVEKYAGGWGIGRHQYQISKDLELDLPCDDHINLLCIHQDQVTIRPENSQIFLTSDFCPIAGLYYYPGCFSLQPHPEFQPDYLVDILKLRRGEKIDPDLVDQALETIYAPVDAKSLKKWVLDEINKKAIDNHS